MSEKLSERMRLTSSGREVGLLEDFSRDVQIGKWANEVAHLEAELAACQESYSNLSKSYNATCKQVDGYIAEIAGMRDKWTPPDEVTELQAQVEALRDMLRRLEFSDHDRCPVCYGKVMESVTVTAWRHAPECELRALLEASDV